MQDLRGVTRENLCQILNMTDHSCRSLSRSGVSEAAIINIMSGSSAMTDVDILRISKFIGIPECAFFHKFENCIDRVLSARDDISRSEKMFLCYVNESIYQLKNIAPKETAFSTGPQYDEKYTIDRELANLEQNGYMPMVTRMPIGIYGILSKQVKRKKKIILLNLRQPVLHTIRVLTQCQGSSLSMSSLSPQAAAMVNNEAAVKATSTIIPRELTALYKYVKSEIGTTLSSERFFNGKGLEYHLGRRTHR